jgi:peptidoglycan hydrolase CwlO-like protein
MNSSSNGGPTGIDPFGECPNNPELTLDAAKEQIHMLSKQVETAEAEVKRTKEEMKQLKIQLETFRNAARGMHHQLAQSRGE